jgi:quinol monooxygenase YgiN
MDEQYYTQASWKVKPGNEQRFIQTWKTLREAVGDDKGPLWGSLIQNVNDSTQFVTFAEWESREAAEAALKNPNVGKVIGEMMALCSDGAPGLYRLAGHMER